LIYETVILKLESVKSGPVTIGEQDEFTLKIYEDDLIIFLDWNATAADSVDMDLFVWLDDEPLTTSQNVSVNPSTSGEAVFLPAGLPYEEMGMSYTYYSGKSDSVGFKVDFLNLGGTINNGGSELSYTNFYRLANKNRYDSASHPDHKDHFGIVQTLTKNKLNYTISDIVKDPTSSRVRTLDRITGRRGTRKDPVFNLRNFK
jgi:hypothetical protein